jgi:hypothetical protein
LEKAEAKAIDSTMLPGQKDLLKDFRELTAALVSEGFFLPDRVHVAKRLAEIVLLHALGIWLLFSDHVAAGLVILGIVCGRCGWVRYNSYLCNSV